MMLDPEETSRILHEFFYTDDFDPAAYEPSQEVTDRVWKAQQEAAYVLHCLGGTKLELPIFIDVEYSGDYPRGRADRLSNTQREVIINAFCRVVMDAGYEAGVYSGEYYYKNNLDYTSLSKYTLWLASYTRSARLPDFPGSYDMWQFTDSGLVNGITGIVDMNASF